VQQCPKNSDGTPDGGVHDLFCHQVINTFNGLQPQQQDIVNFLRSL